MFTLWWCGVQAEQLKGALLPTKREAPAVERIAVTDEMKVRSRICKYVGCAMDLSCLALVLHFLMTLP